MHTNWLTLLNDSAATIVFVCVLLIVHAVASLGAASTARYDKDKKRSNGWPLN